jgi:hypothetical protein
MKRNTFKVLTVVVVCALLAVPVFGAKSNKSGTREQKQVTSTNTTSSTVQSKPAARSTSETQTDAGETKIDQGTTSSDTPTPSPASPATGEEIKWQVLSAGGTYGTSTNYQHWGTLGQTATGPGSSDNYGINHGFWQVFTSGGGGCCVGITGNVDGDLGELVDIGDLTALIAYLYIPPNPVPICFEEANVDGDGGGLVDIGDLTALIAYLYIPPNPVPSTCP